jgi:hypothetical protein
MRPAMRPGDPNLATAASWTADAPPAIAFRLVRADGEWRRAEGLLAALERRDVGLGPASNGVLGAWHVRVAADAASLELDWHAHDLDFAFVYVLDGSIEIEHETGDAVTLARTDVAMMPALLRHRAVVSRDFEALVMIAPGDWQRLALAETSAVDATPRGWWSGPPRYGQDGEAG